jgi:hypothetical protein
MLKNRRSRISNKTGAKTIKTGPLCDDLYRWKGMVMILDNVRGFSAN